MSPVQASFEASTSQLRNVRESLRTALVRAGEPEADWLLIATELATNAIESGAGTHFDVTLVADERAIELVVSNEGPGFTPLAPSVAPVTQHRGRGLAIVQSLVDEFDVSVDNGRTTVCCRRARRSRNANRSHAEAAPTALSSDT